MVKEIEVSDIILTNILSTRHKLVSSDRREPHLRKFPHVSWL